MKRFKNIRINEFAKELNNFLEENDKLSDILPLDRIGSITIDNDKKIELINERIINTKRVINNDNTISEEVVIEIAAMYQDSKFYTFEIIYLSARQQVVDLGDENYVRINRGIQYRLGEELPKRGFKYYKEGHHFYSRQIEYIIEDFAMFDCNGVENPTWKTIISGELHTDEIYIDNWEEMFEL